MPTVRSPGDSRPSFAEPIFQPQRGGMFIVPGIVPGGREPKLRQERHVTATCRPAGAFGRVRSRAINMSLLTELSAATLELYGRLHFTTRRLRGSLSLRERAGVRGNGAPECS